MRGWGEGWWGGEGGDAQFPPISMGVLGGNIFSRAFKANKVWKLAKTSFVDTLNLSKFKNVINVFVNGISKKSYSENKTLYERWKMLWIRNWASDGKTGFVKIAQIETWNKLILMRHNMIWVRQFQGSTLANWANKAQERPALIFWKARFHPQRK